MKKFIRALQSNYKPPNRRTITRHIYKEYATLKQNVKTELAEVKELSVTTETWRNNCVKTRLGLTIHYFKQGALKSTSLGIFSLDKPHTGNYLGETISEICKN